MTNYAVLGLGMMGEAIAFDILSNDESAIIYGYEISNDRIKELNNKFIKYDNRFFINELNLNINIDPAKNELATEFIDRNITIVFGAIDYQFNEYLSKICIKSGSSFFDLGGNPDIVKKQKLLNDEAVIANITVIPDLGLAPGMANIVAKHLMDKFSTLKKCQIRVGGLPQPKYKKTILNYQQVFSIRGLTNEYLEDAIVIDNGKIQIRPSLLDLEKINFPEPYGELEAFQTAGGTSSLPEIYDGKIDELNYKTIRYPGHCQFIRFLKEFELLSSEPNNKFANHNPREVVEFYLQKYLPRGDPDAVLIQIKIEGKIGNQDTKLTARLIDLFDENTGYSSMARTTAFPISIVGQMVAKGIISKKGVVSGELVVPQKEFTEELKKRGISFNISYN